MANIKKMAYIELVEMKITMYEQKNSLDRINVKLDIALGKISVLEDIYYRNLSKMKQKKRYKNEKSISNRGDNFS